MIFVDHAAQFWHIKGMSKRPEWPKEVTVGSATVKVYQRDTGGFRLAYNRVGEPRKFESAKTEGAAMERAEQLALTLSGFGAKVAQAPPELIANAITFNDTLALHGVTLRDGVTALDGWLRMFRSLEAINRTLAGAPVTNNNCVTKSIADAITEFLKQKESNNVSAAYLQDLDYRLSSFGESFKCDVAAVTPAMVQQWFDGRKLGAANYMNFRRVLNVFFEHCQTREYCAANPIAKTDARKVVRGDTKVWTPAEMRALLKASKNGFQLMLAVCGFAGIRTNEFFRLTWADVDFKSGNLVLGSTITKTASRRLVPISANLRAWLEQAEHKTGKLWKGEHKDLMCELKNCARNSKTKWKHNALRHSFCSYRLALTQDVAKVAFEAGNSAAMIHRHYKQLVTEAEATEWFNILP